jgi:hypothetical protein
LRQRDVEIVMVGQLGLREHFRGKARHLEVQDAFLELVSGHHEVHAEADG